MPRISTPALEGPFQAAKWFKIQALIDGAELASIFEEKFEIYPLSGHHALADLPMAKAKYLAAYTSWVELLKNGIAPKEEEFRPFAATMWAESEDNLWLQQIPGERYIVKPSAPFVQVQIHQMGYSDVDDVFRPMSLSQNSIFWGIQFSFPQVYQDPKTQQLLEAEESPLFEKIRKWTRDISMPTPMLVAGKRVNIPIRLGKTCFPWINNHPGLKQKGLAVHVV